MDWASVLTFNAFIYKVIYVNRRETLEWRIAAQLPLIAKNEEENL